MHRRLFIAALSTIALACGSNDSTPSRCANCGMLVHADSGWRAGAKDGAEAELVFDAPKCLFRHVQRHPDTHEGWVVEYYSQEQLPTEGLHYVIGTDLESPMGRDLVPVDGEEAAQRMLTDHHGEVILRYDEITESVIDALF